MATGLPRPRALLSPADLRHVSPHTSAALLATEPCISFNIALDTSGDLRAIRAALEREVVVEVLPSPTVGTERDPKRG